MAEITISNMVNVLTALTSKKKQTLQRYFYHLTLKGVHLYYQNFKNQKLYNSGFVLY